MKSFDKRKTRKNNFLTPKEVFFMNATDDCRYFEDKKVKAFSINYKNDNFETLILLPKYQIDINYYISNLISLL